MSFTEQTLMSGYLQVLEGGFFQLKPLYSRKYFILQTNRLNSALFWYNNEDDREPLGSLLVKPNVTVTKNEDVTGIVIRSDDTSLTLKASSVAESVDWIQALYFAIKAPAQKFVLTPSGAYLPSCASEEISDVLDFEGSSSPAPKGAAEGIPLLRRGPSSIDLYATEAESPSIVDFASLSYEARTMLQTEFRQRVMSNVSEFSNLDAWTPTPDVLEMSFTSSLQDLDLPPVPTTPPPAHDEAPRLSLEITAPKMLPPIGADPAMSNSDFLQKWIAIRRPDVPRIDIFE